MASLVVTDRAREVLRRVRAERSGTLTITIDGGCCEGTAPHLYEDYVLAYGAHEVGRAEGIPVYVPGRFRDAFEATPLTIDVIDDQGSEAMSLETELGVRLVLRQG